MTSRAALVSVFVVGLAGHAVTADAQVRWGRGPIPRSGVCFYEDADFRGQYFCASPGQRLSSLPRGFGDHISSIRVIGEADVTVFQDRSFRGRSARFGDDVVNLRRGGWNDSISSILIGESRFGRNDRPGDRRNDRRDDRQGNQRREGGFGGIFNRVPVWGRGAVPREGACFYEDSNFRGQYFCVDRGDSFASMPSGFNDRISSIRVFRGGVSLYRDDDFRGRSTRVTSDVPNLGSSWGDRISSIRVF